MTPTGCDAVVAEHPRGAVMVLKAWDSTHRFVANVSATATTHASNIAA
jgi:hypothetical protein